MKKDMAPNRDLENITPTQSQVGEVIERKVIEEDAVFGEIQEGDVNYRDVSWMGTTALMMKTQIGLGVLSMPKVFDTLGIIPGIIMLLVIAGMTSWSNWMVGVFKLRHPEVYGIDDVGKVLFGRWGFELLGAAYTLYWIFVSGSAMLSISIAFNALSDHAICTAIFVAVAAIIGFTFSSIQTLARISWLAWLGAGSIIIAVCILTIAVGVQGHPPPVSGVIPDSDYKLFGSPSFVDAMTAISTLCLTYAGTPAFFNIVSEMRDPRLYSRALAICQITVTTIYIVAGTVIYYYCGSHVSSPALGSAGPLIKKITYGLALPGLSISTVIMLHLPAKHIFMRILRGSRHLTGQTPTHWITWLGSTFTVSSIVYIIASSIPVFSGLVSLVGALLATSLCFQPMGCMWLYDNWALGQREKSLGWCLKVAWCVFVILTGTFLTIGGTYGSIVSINHSYKQSGGSAAWSCANNDM
ncbi:amino acid transporter [Aspergillus steynii IBT 23096]|uniref:Amino acid transporter n=1 Tax=Aspergillus steynii IBT 23096 TaxID=1392250 RepID=A0A2I2GKD9_9EURO|nr:amino acid transporter [Aspergillus steynii IBT 23096]PLB53353.1 amino acid transporter [Aspergillus steynii IBT 23096]